MIYHQINNKFKRKRQFYQLYYDFSQQVVKIYCIFNFINFMYGWSLFTII